MNTQQFGTLELFDGADFTDYSEHLNASNAAEREVEEKVSVTICLIGKTAYITLKDLRLPDLPADKTYDQLTQNLKN